MAAGSLLTLTSYKVRSTVQIASVERTSNAMCVHKLVYTDKLVCSTGVTAQVNTR
jgi:hypothetical protein